jgi:ectoine hydroxylase-related dioxygenase (phytanoyl-CoA dioxygenase family)
MAAGDATFHSGWTLHNAPGNVSATTREVMTIIYYEDGIRVAEPDNKNRVSDLARWLPGLQAGEVAASELNPLLYKLTI